MIINMPIFESCGCCGLRIGVIILSFLMMMFSLLVSISAIYLLIVPDLEALMELGWKKLYVFNGGTVVFNINSTNGHQPLNLTNKELLGMEIFLLLLAVLFAISWLSNCLLLVGAVKRMSILMVQWMVIQWIGSLCVVAVFGICLWRLLVSESTGKYWWILTFEIGIFILLCLSLLLVASLYHTLRQREIPDSPDNVELLNRHLWVPKQYPNNYYD